MSERTRPGTAALSAPRLRIVSDLVRGNPVQVLVVILLSLAGTAATVAVPLLVRELIEAISDGEPVLRWLALMVPLGVGSALAAAASAYLLARLGERFIMRLRARVMEHTLRVPLQAVRTEGPGDLVARITSDAMLLRSVVDTGVVQLPVAVVAALATVVIMAVLDWLLVASALLVFALTGIALGVLIRKVRRQYEEVQTVTGELAQHYTATLAALATIKAYRAERHTAAALRRGAEQVTGQTITAVRYGAMLIPVLSFGQEIALAAIVIAGGARIVAGELSLATFVAFILYLLQLITPVTLIVTGVARLQMGLAARRRFEELLAVPVEPDPVTTVPAVDPDTAVAVEFHSVDFQYADAPVLKSVSFRAGRRGLTALVGPSGAGKSTVLSIVERFLIPTGGRVEVLGHDLHRWPLAALRSRVAYVDQTFTLVEGSIRENLSLGCDPRPDTELLAALAEVGLREDIRSLPDGLDTVLGRAVDLSGGQRQRLALARALLSGADIVLLDEPTSQLDSWNEERLRETVDRLARSRAVIVVAHRLSTVRNADHVVMMVGGRVTAAGTHAELMERSPEYRHLVRSQSWVDEPSEVTVEPAGSATAVAA